MVVQIRGRELEEKVHMKNLVGTESTGELRTTARIVSSAVDNLNGVLPFLETSKLDISLKNHLKSLNK